MNNKKPSGYWNVKENCIEDALKYNTSSEWRKNGGSVYKAAKRNGWLKEICELNNW